MLTYKDTRNQSKAVYAQFGESVWKKNADINSTLGGGDSAELRNIGIGKTLLCVAMGPSLEREIETIKENRAKFDIACCDKAFAVLMDNGIKPDYVFLADANILTKWVERHLDKTIDVTLIAGAYSNPEWTSKWLGKKYFYVNEDSIETEKIFKPIIEKHGTKVRIIPAGSNVSNGMICFVNGSNNSGLQNFMGYDKYLLVGYDFSWSPDGNYYAFNNPKPKRYYMHHRTLLDYKGNLVYTSENLLFSAKWIRTYLTAFNINAVNCSEFGILDIPARGKLSEELKKIDANPKLANSVKEAFKTLEITGKAFEQAKHNFIKAQEALQCH